MDSIEKRTTGEGDITYRVKIRLRGFPPQSASFSRLTDARQWAQNTESAIREGRYFKNSQAKKRTLNDAIDRYTKEILPRKKDKGYIQKKHLLWWKESLGHYTLADVTTPLIIEHRAKLTGQKNKFGRIIGDSTTNRYITTLGHVFSVAINEWEWLEANPVGRIKKLKEPRGRVRFLSDKERNTLLAACQESKTEALYPVVVLALSTGARRMEILNLKWKDVDLKRKAIVLHETKNDERRVLPLHGFALSLLKELHAKRNLRTDYVFPSDKKNQPIDIRTAWENAVVNAEIKDFRFHDLRHTAASYLAMNGASLAELAEVLGHKTLQMVKRYAHLSEAHTSKVVARMNEKIFGQ